MATKKSETAETPTSPARLTAIEERRKAKEQATTVDGSETATIPGFGQGPNPS